MINEIDIAFVSHSPCWLTQRITTRAFNDARVVNSFCRQIASQLKFIFECLKINSLLTFEICFHCPSIIYNHTARRPPFTAERKDFPGNFQFFSLFLSLNCGFRHVVERNVSMRGNQKLKAKGLLKISLISLQKLL